MARDIWAETEEVETTGEYVASNKSDPIPDGTKCLSNMEDIKWHKFDGSDHEILNITWRVIEGEYDDKVYFQKIKINGEDPSSNFYKEDKQEKIIDSADKMFRAIDKNAGGFVYGLKRKPTDAELKQYLVGCTMIVTLGEFNGNQFVRGISAAEGAPVVKPKAVGDKFNVKKKSDAFDDSDIPF